MMKNRGKNLKALKEVLTIFGKGKRLPGKYKPHPLKGKWVHCNECHIKSDWLMIWSRDGNKITLIRTGTHSDLFK